MASLDSFPKRAAVETDFDPDFVSPMNPKNGSPFYEKTLFAAFYSKQDPLAASADQNIRLVIVS